MSDLFAQLLLTALVLAVPATASVFAGEPSRPGLRGPYRALLAAGTVAGAALGVGAVAGAGALRTALVAVVLGVLVLAFGPAARAWTLRGLAAWSLGVAAGAAYLGHLAIRIAGADLTAVSLVGGAALWMLELFVCVLALGYLWELLDVLARWDWRRHTEVRREVEPDPQPEVAARRPFVSLHVPTHDEPPDLVIATLERLVALEYDDFEILVVDNNTEDPDLWRPVERFCRTHEKLGFFHLEDGPENKSGALDHALEKVDPRTELVGVVDADQLVDPDFLSRCVPLFAEPGLAFVQTPQGHRDGDVDPYFRRLDRSYAYYSDASQRARQERNAAELGGTTGLVRRDALVDVGGWEAWCVDGGAELGLRLLKAGWSGTRVEHTFGHGLLPVTFEELKRERFRWAFDGVQLLRLHWRTLIPGRRTGDNALTLGQRWAYLTGGLQWFGDLAGLLLTGLLLVGAVEALAGDWLVLRLVAAPLALGVLLLGPLRWVALLRRTAGAGWGEAAGALGLQLALGLVVALASIRGLVARRASSLRTPQPRGDRGWREAVRSNLVETVLALTCLVGATVGLVAAVRGTEAGLVIGVLLALQGAGYAAALLSSRAAARADLTPELRRRRRAGLLSPTRVARASLGWGIAPVLVAGAVIAVVMTVAGPFGSSRLDRPRSSDAAGNTEPRPGETPSTLSTSPAVPLSPLSALLSMSPSASQGQPASAATRPAGGSPRPSVDATVTSAPTPAPSQPGNGHGRPTWVPKPSPTKHPH